MLNNATLKAAIAVSTVVGVVLGYAGVAMAVEDSDAVAAVSAGATTLGDTLKAVALFALPIAAGILAISFGWRMARKFVRA